MAKGLMYDDEGRLMIDVTKAPRLMDGPRPIDRSRDYVVDGMTIDRSLMGPSLMDRPTGQFQTFRRMNPRPVGIMEGGERSVVTSRGAGLMEGADRRLMGGYGGVNIMDGKTEVTNLMGQRSVMDAMPEGFATIRSRDNRLSLSPEAVGLMGERQLMEDRAADPLMGPTIGADALGRRLSVRKQLQAQADQGFVRPGTDAANRETMRLTRQDAQQEWMERNRPRQMMERGNLASQIQEQTRADLNRPQVMTQDGVMAGWDPMEKRIVSDTTAAREMAAAQRKPVAMTYDQMDINELTKSINDTIGSTKMDPALRQSMSLELMGAKTPDEVAKVNAKYNNPIAQEALVALGMQMDALKRRSVVQATAKQPAKGGTKASKWER